MSMYVYIQYIYVLSTYGPGETEGIRGLGFRMVRMDFKAKFSFLLFSFFEKSKNQKITMLNSFILCSNG
jgi:uncharacterized RDD family membrane protein YckC